MKLLRPMLIFGVLMGVTLGVGFLIHHSVLVGRESPALELLPAFYGTNGILGLVIGVAIIYLSEARPEITGFSFMGGSLVKFAVFFLLFFPLLSEEESARKNQFLAFFIPYAITMILEVWYLIRYLNKKT